MNNWHRMFGMTMTDFFTDSPFVVELEKDLSLKQQFPDVVILRKGPGEIVEPLPDGLDNLVEHNLLTYKSLREPLDAAAIDELLGHLVNYRKQVSPHRKPLLPIEQFRMYGISTRVPRKLRKEVKLEERQPGVYEAVWGTHRVRIVVLNEIPVAPRNALWEIYSADPDKVMAGKDHYRPHTEDMSTVLDGLFKCYELEGITMPYTWDDWRRDYVREHLHQMTPEERLEGLSPEDRLRGLSLGEIDKLDAYIQRMKQQAAREPKK